MPRFCAKIFYFTKCKMSITVFEIIFNAFTHFYFKLCVSVLPQKPLMYSNCQHIPCITFLCVFRLLFSLTLVVVWMLFGVYLSLVPNRTPFHVCFLLFFFLFYSGYTLIIQERFFVSLFKLLHLEIAFTRWNIQNRTIQYKTAYRQAGDTYVLTFIFRMNDSLLRDFLCLSPKCHWLWQSSSKQEQ